MLHMQVFSHNKITDIREHREMIEINFDNLTIWKKK